MRKFKNGFRQRDCKACGAPNHRRHDTRCVSVEVFQAVRDFARANGRTWRSKLRALWVSGKDEGPLRSARNLIGPSRIAKVFPEEVRVNEAARSAKREALATGEITRKRSAYTAVIEERGYCLGVAVEGEAGYHPVREDSDAGGTFETYELASACADAYNASLGLTKEEATRIVISTMRGSAMRGGS